MRFSNRLPNLDPIVDSGQLFFRYAFHITQITMSKPLPDIPPYGESAIEVKNLTFAYRSSDSGTSIMNDYDNNLVLEKLDLSLASGSRCLLIGANGSGKSTLLRILSGRHLTKSVDATTGEEQSVRVLGLNAFHDTRLNFHRAYLDCDWGMRNVSFVGNQVPLMADIPVRNMMEKLQNTYPERRDELVDMLGIDVSAVENVIELSCTMEHTSHFGYHS